MYNARERYDDKYFRDHYGILEENIVMLEVLLHSSSMTEAIRTPQLCEGEKGDANLA